ncbi:retrovirus-related pol polyprotein from transposon TNT 1-94, partial [Tanacetum coccineum]
DSPDDKEDTRSSQEFSSAKETDQTECHKCGKKSHFAKDCWSKTSIPSYQSPFQPTLLYSSEHKHEPRHTKDFEAKYNKVKAKLALLSSSTSALSSSTSKNKGLIAETCDCDEEEVSSDDNEVTKVKALMDLADEERVFVGKESARNDDWIKISMKKIHTLIEMEDNDDRKSFLDYLCIDLNYVEEKRNNLMSKHRNLIQELNTCKEYLLVLKQAKLDLLTMKHCIREQIPTKKKKILGNNQLTQDTFSSRPKDLIFVKYSADNVSITHSNQHRLSEAENSTLSNHDTGKIPSVESQRNTTNPLVAVTESSATNYDSADESSVCSTPLPPLKKLDGAEPVFGPKTIKSILKIISLRRGMKPRNSQHVTKNCKTCGSNVHTTSDHNDIEWFRKREALQAKKAESFKASKTGSSSALRSKTPTKRTFCTLSLGLQYPKCSGFNLKGYSDSNCVGYNMDRIRTSGACQLLEGKLVY